MEEFSQTFPDAALFRGIRASEIGPMLQCVGGYRRTFEKGACIYLEESVISNIGLVLRGAVHMVKEDVWGNTTVLARSEAGEIFGETFACGSSTVSAVTFLAGKDTEVLFLPFSRVMHTCTMACGFHQKLVDNMVQLIADKNRALLAKLEVISKRSLRDKILAYLSLQAQQQGTRYFEIPLGRLELADYLCVDRSALTRELNHLRDAGILDFDKNMFRLL